MSLFLDIDSVTATIAPGGSISAQVNLGEKTLVGISMLSPAQPYLRGAS